MRKDDLVKEAILRAAEKLFQKWGIAKTTMEDIAREAGKGKSTLYYYFKNKEEVLEMTALSQIIKITDKAREEIAKKDTAREKLIVYAYSTFKEIRESLTLYEIARGEIKADRTLIQGLLQKYEAIERKILESILRFGIERKEFKSIHAADIKASARAIMIIKNSLTINLLIDNDDKKLIDLAMKLLSEGL